jgi:hypothetical protein
MGSRPTITKRSLWLVAVVSLLAAGAVAPAGAAATTTKAAAKAQTFTFYTSVKNERYINNVDDLSRGEGHNPFGNVSSVKPPTNEKTSGPLAGDEAMYAFDLFSDASHKSSAGNVIFVCWYNFNRNALCDASFQLSGGTLIGKGAFNFSATKFTLAVLGGTSKYKGMTGAVQITALGAKTQAQPVYRVVPMLQAQQMSFSIQPV